MVIMSPHFCAFLVLVSWFIIFYIFILHFLLLMQLTFMVDTEIPHFFCELSQVLKVASSDNLSNIIFLYVTTALLCMFPMPGILCSYYQIVCSLLRMFSVVSKYKAFSTCGSHLCMVCFFLVLTSVLL
jgi:olfactory receptor